MRLALIPVAVLTLSACGSGYQDSEEVGHASADVFASLDESGTGGSFAALNRPDLMKGDWLDRAGEWLEPSAYAGACWGATFAECNAGVRSKNFGDCAIGPFKLTGSVDLTFSDMSCSMLPMDASVTRVANFTLTGRRSASLEVSSPGGGQRITRTGANGFTYTVLGMERVMTGAGGHALFDISTRTLEDLQVTGLLRRNRVINGGKLEITHHLAGYTTVLEPQNVTWDGTCNCPVSGQLTGTVTGKMGRSETASVEITGCGSGVVTFGAESKTVSFDRCTAL